MPNSAILLIHCPDRKGIVAGVSGFLHRHGANILHADQHQDNNLALFFMRVEWDLTDFALDDAGFARSFNPLLRAFKWNRAWRTRPPGRKWAIFASQHLHCLVDLLFRHRIGELRCDIPLVISNHPAARDLAEFYGVGFHHLPMEPANKAEGERAQLDLPGAARH